MKLLLLVTALASTLLAQQHWETAAGGKMSFEVASVKPVPRESFSVPPFPLDSGDSFAPTGGRFTATFPLRVYIQFAYKLHLTPEEMTAALAPLPKWVGEDTFEIQARAFSSNVPNPNPTKDQFRLMMQSLLSDRFKLAVHFETQVVPAFAMVLAKPGKTGPQLQPHPDGASCNVGSAAPPCGAYIMLKKPAGMHTESHGTTMDHLAEGLTMLDLGRPVVNQTGLNGNFDISLDWTPDYWPPAPNGDPPGATLVTAIREQLGIKLDSTKAPARTLFVDHVERPAAN